MTEVDRLDPAPRPPRAPRRRKGEIEKAAQDFLGELPGKLRRDPVAKGILKLARSLDEGGESLRDETAALREIRQCEVQLREWNPAGETGDGTDASRAQVENIGALYVLPEAGES